MDVFDENILVMINFTITLHFVLIIRTQFNISLDQRWLSRTRHDPLWPRRHPPWHTPLYGETTPTIINIITTPSMAFKSRRQVLTNENCSWITCAKYPYMTSLPLNVNACMHASSIIWLVKTWRLLFCAVRRSRNIKQMYSLCMHQHVHVHVPTSSIYMYMHVYTCTCKVAR